MSVTSQQTIWCDRCSNWKMFDVPRIHLARAEARTLGWKRVRGTEEDICPRCVKEGLVAKPPEGNENEVQA